MKVDLVNNIIFLGKTKIFQSGKNKIEEVYNDDNVLLKRLIRDEFDRDIDAKNFDLSGNVIAHQHKEYFENESERGFVETFKNQYQEYTRKAYTKIENGLKHNIDNFQSKSGKSYINDFVYNMSGKLIKIISNGKSLQL